MKVGLKLGCINELMDAQMVHHDVSVYQTFLQPHTKKSSAHNLNISVVRHKIEETLVTFVQKWHKWSTEVVHIECTWMGPVMGPLMWAHSRSCTCTLWLGHLLG